MRLYSSDANFCYACTWELPLATAVIFYKAIWTKSSIKTRRMRGPFDPFYGWAIWVYLIFF